MTFEQATYVVLENILNTKTGEKLKSYNKLATEHMCSRAVFQKAITELEKSDVLGLDKSKGGNILQYVDCQRVLTKYYPTILISCPKIILSNSHDELSFRLIDELNDLDSLNCFTYVESSRARISMINNNTVDLAIVTSTYFDLINNPQLKVLNSFTITTPIYTSLKACDSSSELQYNIDELSTLDVSTCSEDYFVPNEYYLVCKSHIYNLLSNQK